MNFHWALRTNTGSDTVEGMSLLSQRLDKSNYKSILLTYFSNSSDNWIKAARSVNVSEKISYMIAIRTYSISPEYCAMICRSFEEMFPNRLSLNIVHGLIQKNEDPLSNLVSPDKRLLSLSGRRSYTKDWLDKFLSMDYGKANIYLSGNSDETRAICNNFNIGHGAGLHKFKKYLSDGNKVINNVEMVAASILIRDTYEEALSFIHQSSESSMLHWTIYGDEKSVIKQLKDLSELGVTDIMIDKYSDDDEFYRIDKVVEEWQ